jgi:hypothetical protein
VKGRRCFDAVIKAEQPNVKNDVNTDEYVKSSGHEEVEAS